MSVRSQVVHSHNLARVLLLMTLASFALSTSLRSQENRPSDTSLGGGLTLPQFRQLISSSRAANPSPKKNSPTAPAIDYQSGDDAFLQIMLSQACIAAARQSLDRLAGWNKAIKPRIENQSIAPLDVEILAVAEKQAASEVARLEAELRRNAEWANRIAGREISAPLVALVDAAVADSADGEALGTMEKEVLTRSRDLLAKLFQSYSVGGIGVTELLWQERRAADAESRYRQWAARAAVDAAKRAADLSK
jgi:hypothetical protein